MPWSPAEDELLQPYIAATPDMRLLQVRLPHRSHKAIEHRLYALRHPERIRQSRRAYRLRRRIVVEPDDSRRETLLLDIYAFIARYHLTKTQFGSMALRSPSYIASLEAGRDPRITEERVRAFMAAGDPRVANRFSNTARAYATAKARNIAEESAAKAFRANDPVEQAKLVIRRARFHCFEAEIIKPEAVGMFMIGARLVTKAELFAFARKHGWEG